MKDLWKELRGLKELNLYRQRRLREGVKDFCSNDYLALRNHPEVVEEAIRVLREEGLGSGASQLVSGYSRYHMALEEDLAGFKGTECCVLFGSGYLANLGAIGALVGEKDVIFSDELNHASIIDGCRLSKAKVIVFKHRDYKHLEELLKEHRKNYRRALIISDSVFSMDGDIADLRELNRLAKEYDAILYLDEAHATGVLGTTGKGILEEFSQGWEGHMIIMGTLSKALGSYGAFVCGSKILCEYLVNKARSLIFSTSLPPSVCAGARKALEIIRREPQRIKRLKELTLYVYNRLKELHLDVLFYGTPIIPIMLYEEKKALEVSRALLEDGLFIQAIRYPTVPLKKARLRLTVSLNYTQEDVEILLSSLSKHLS
ncbi:8-amino-7-oxononanoate synthase [Thermocrinis minervae]|uniref:8-amino-7-ketopelargonate synthase n=1 Tax=Thermocrinis minervae TaxID=381751 RepID=A0A1M6TAR6_9AQUI|nr:8-amino-7-oxononanoate synthase [Thermocrinis minervae]SHK54060.1 8-amino-7-oxononanoate synthase [Thermocrinis minervae]